MAGNGRALWHLGTVEPPMDPKDPKKDLLAELDLADLYKNRAEATEKQKEAAERLNDAKAGHFVACVVGGCVSMVAAIYLWLGDLLPDGEPTRVFLLSGSVILWLGLWIAAVFPTATVYRRQDEATAASRQLKAIDDKIAFCHLVLDEAKRVKVRRYAEAWVEKELS
jgi:hypothetical protein